MSRNARGERGSGVWSGVVMRVNRAARKIGAESGCGARVNDGALESKLLSLADGGGARGESGEGGLGRHFEDPTRALRYVGRVGGLNGAHIARDRKESRMWRWGAFQESIPHVPHGGRFGGGWEIATFGVSVSDRCGSFACW